MFELPTKDDATNLPGFEVSKRVSFNDLTCYFLSFLLIITTIPALLNRSDFLSQRTLFVGGSGGVVFNLFNAPL